MAKTSTQKYFSEFLDIIEKNSVRGMDLDYPDYKKSAINWEEYKADLWVEFEKETPNSVDDERMSDLITLSLERLEDGHSHNVSAIMNSDNRIKNRPKEDPLRGEHIGRTAYLFVPRELTASDEEFEKFRDELRTRITELDGSNIDGWVIDLRGSYGGGMWATMAALWSFMPQNEPAGYFLTPKDKMSWGPVNDSKLYQLKNPHLPIAVLTGDFTSSAGEAITIAFRGLPNVKSFGKPTFGSSTANMVFSLSDGRRFALTTSVMADRNSIPFGGKIEPDLYFAGNFDDRFNGTLLENSDFDPKADTLIMKSMDWIREFSTPKCLIQPKAPS